MSAVEEPILSSRTPRRGVYARPIFELVSPWCEAVDDDHEACIGMWMAARWPNPAPQHDLAHWKDDIDVT